MLSQRFLVILSSLDKCYTNHISIVDTVLGVLCIGAEIDWISVDYVAAGPSLFITSERYAFKNHDGHVPGFTCAC